MLQEKSIHVETVSLTYFFWLLLYCWCSIVQLLSYVWLFVTLWTAAPGLPYPSLSLGVCSNSCPLSQQCHPTISSCHPLVLLPTVFPNIRVFSNESTSHQVAEVLELQLQHQTFQWIFSVDYLKDWLVWSPYCPRDSQESSPAPQFKSINSLALSLLYVRT